MTILSLHIIAGIVALLSGTVALVALKGADVHRKSGRVFVGSMLIMAAVGGILAAFKPERISVVAGALTVYLVATALLTVRPPVRGARWVARIVLVWALVVSGAGYFLGIAGATSPSGLLDGLPPQPAFMFGTVALFAAIGDARMLVGGLQGRRRITRHLWRMCFALFIASSSFFLGQQDVFPGPLQIMPVLVVLALAPLGALGYWWWRVRGRRLEDVGSDAPAA